MTDQRSGDDGVVSSCNQPDYSAVDLPSTSREEYDWRERRAELLLLVKEAGTPDALNQTEVAERYGVSQQQISKDLDRLATHVREELVDRDRRAFRVGTVVERSIRGLLDEGDYRQAARTAMDYDEWITDFHDLTEMQRRLDALETERHEDTS